MYSDTTEVSKHILYNILIRIIRTHMSHSIKLGISSYIQTSRILIGVMLASVLGGCTARYTRLVWAFFYLGFILRDNDGNIVNRHLVRLRCAAIDILETWRMSVLTPRFVQFTLLLLTAAGCTTAAAPFLLAWFQKWHILLLRNLNARCVI